MTDRISMSASAELYESDIERLRRLTELGEQQNADLMVDLAEQRAEVERLSEENAKLRGWFDTKQTRELIDEVKRLREELSQEIHEHNVATTTSATYAKEIERLKKQYQNLVHTKVRISELCTVVEDAPIEKLKSQAEAVAEAMGELEVAKRELLRLIHNHFLYQQALRRSEQRSRHR